MLVNLNDVLKPAASVVWSKKGFLLIYTLLCI